MENIEIEWVVSDPKFRHRKKVYVRYCGIENVIEKGECVGRIKEETVHLWEIIGLSREQIREIVKFLRGG